MINDLLNHPPLILSSLCDFRNGFMWHRILPLFGPRVVGDPCDLHIDTSFKVS